MLCPFTILIDRQEKAPWSFNGMRALSSTDKDCEPLEVRTEFISLGAGNGDYSIAGLRDRVAVERKSCEDLHGTLLGWKARRGRFQRELDRLAFLDFAAVVVEASFGAVLASAPEYGEKTATENRKILLGTILHWQQRYRVPWIFCDDRRLAEITAFRFLEWAWTETKGGAW